MILRHQLSLRVAPVLSGEPPPTPADFTFSATPDAFLMAYDLEFTWSPAGGATSYRLELNGSTYNNVSSPLTLPSYGYDVAPTANLYAVNSGGSSIPSSFIAYIPPNPPSEFQVTNQVDTGTEYSVDLAWAASFGFSGSYTIQPVYNGTPQSQIFTAATSASGILVPYGTSYLFEVYATSINGVSPMATVSGSTP